MNISPLISFLENDIPPSDLAKLVDELIYDYTMMLVRLQKLEKEDIHEDTEQFLFYLRKLRDVLILCEDEQF